MSRAFLYLVPAAKGLETTPRITGLEVDKTDDLFQRLSDGHDSADRECNLPIAFKSKDQRNPCRDLLLAFIRLPSFDTGLPLAERLAAVTTNRSRNALLCLAVGVADAVTKLTLSRFPADQGIHAVSQAAGLKVRYLRRLFMRSSRAYKAVVFKGASTVTDFWDGFAVDKQVSSSDASLSQYWICEFLLADMRTTGKAGTRRLAVALKHATRHAPLSVKRQVVSAIELSSAAAGKTLSAREFCKMFGFSEDTVAALKKQFKAEEHFDERFRFSETELRVHVSYKFTELDNGAVLMAHAHDYKRVFRVIAAAGDDSTVNISTEGRVVDEGLRKQKL